MEAFDQRQGSQRGDLRPGTAEPAKSQRFDQQTQERTGAAGPCSTSFGGVFARPTMNGILTFLGKISRAARSSSREPVLRRTEVAKAMARKRMLTP